MHRGNDRSGDPSGPGAGGRSGGDGRFARGPSRWSGGGGGGGGGSPAHRSSSRDGGGGGGRFHPYRAPSEYAVGVSGTGGYRGGGGGGGGDFGEADGGQRNRYGGGGGGRGDYSDHDNKSGHVKLFVGSVPRTASEDDVRPLFENHGDVLEVAMIRDRKTGEQQGCCFVKYATSEEAERAIRALHNQWTIPGAMGPVQVRYADGEKERHGSIEHKLFVASLNKQATAKEIEEIFAPFGHVEDVYIMKDGMKQSRGCGFVKFSSKEPALAAMNSLSGTYIMRGCEQPLIVRFADPKRPRPGESRGGPAFGGPGVSPRSDAALVIRPTANLDEPRGRHMPRDAWHPSSPSSVASHQFNNYGSDNPMGIMGGTGTSAADNMFPGNGQTAVPTSSHMGINTSSLQGHHLGGQQIPPLQKPPGPPHNFSLQLQNQQGQHSLVPGLFGQNVPSMQLPGQLPTSQPLTQQNASAGALQAPPAIQSNPMQSVPGQQQLPSNVAPQMMQQPIQQIPSQAPQLLLQQQAAMQSSYQSSQQAIFQLQQQLQLMQQQQQHQQQPNLNQQQPNLNQQQHTQISKQQGQPNQSSTPGAPAAMMPSNINAIPQQVNSPAVSLTCNWTEHTSPEGFKYYYNSITRESKWEKPEEYVLYEQQQQQQHQKLILLQQHQQKLVAQQLQSPPQGQTIQSMQSIQQHPQSHQGHNQMQMKHQELNYNQLQATGNIDPNRIQQGIQAAQERSWKS
ncbi:flowering time control protein FCA-like isoform X2 [Lolium rigidum]|uniref:flowering time control protein FCA-like isoform X2 n=1 Tax=Lolium rigidum TaxID=89674 RepID=UPI001F5D7F9E|nr:flowering time control protein FCA-like isoform X2 [Lolium rigidum]